MDKEQYVIEYMMGKEAKIFPQSFDTQDEAWDAIEQYGLPSAEVKLQEEEKVETLAEKLARFRDMKSEVDPLVRMMKSLEQEIKELVAVTGEIVTVQGATVTTTAPQLRKYWNGKGLEGYAVANPEVLEFMTEKETKRSVRIIVKPEISPEAGW